MKKTKKYLWSEKKVCKRSRGSKQNADFTEAYEFSEKNIARALKIRVERLRHNFNMAERLRKFFLKGILLFNLLVFLFSITDFFSTPRHRQRLFNGRNYSICPHVDSNRARVAICRNQLFGFLLLNIFLLWSLRPKEDMTS